MPDEFAEGVQPDTGQGDGGSESAQPYADYLSRISEEVRGDVEPVFKDWNANVNKQFEQHAEFRKSWEPYEKAGISQFPAETLQWAIQTLQDPAAARAWLDETYGPNQPQEPAQQPDEFAFQDPAQQQLEKLLGEKLGPLNEQLQQFTQWRQELEQRALESQITDQINHEVAALKDAHGKDLPKEVIENFETIIEKFAMPYAEAGANPKQVVEKAWADFQSLSNQLQTAALQAKVDQPEPAEAGGMADLSPQKIDSLKEANRIALEQLRANRAA